MDCPPLSKKKLLRLENKKRKIEAFLKIAKLNDKDKVPNVKGKAEKQLGDNQW